MRQRPQARPGIAEMAFEAAGGDPLLALSLVCDLLHQGLLRKRLSGALEVVRDVRMAA